jgi:hypothetical protein
MTIPDWNGMVSALGFAILFFDCGNWRLFVLDPPRKKGKNER